jgi:hypothetical protein
MYSQLHETKKLLHSKGNSHQTEETTHRIRENLANYTFDKGLIIKIYRELKKLTSQSINDLLK